MPTFAAMLADVVDRPWAALQAVLPGCVPGLELLGPAGRVDATAPRRADAARGTRFSVWPIASLAAQRPDLVICQGFGSWTVQAAAYRSLWPRTKLLLWAQGPAPGWGTPGHLLLRRADAVLAKGETAARAIRRLGVPAARVFTVPEVDPSDLAPFLACPLRRSGRAAHRLIYVGDLVPRAGGLDFVLCAAAWADRNRDRAVEIWMTGDGDLRGVLEAQPLPANMSLRFLGGQASPTLPDVFAECGLLVAPPLSPTAADWIPEAMAAGLPVIGSVRCRAAADLVSPGATGWLFDPHSGGDMAVVIDTAFSADQTTLDAMRLAARTRVSAMKAKDFADRVTSAVAAALFEGAGTAGSREAAARC